MTTPQTPQQTADKTPRTNTFIKNYPLTIESCLAWAVQLETELAEMREENERLKAATAKPEINTHVRLFDLVRYMRSKLHREGLITDEEYGWLCAGPMAMSPKGGSPSRQRLEDYDEIQAQLRDLRGKADGLAGQLGRIKAVIEAHEIDTLDCDRSGEIHCDCLTKELDKAAKLTAAYRAAQGVDATPLSESSR